MNKPIVFLFIGFWLAIAAGFYFVKDDYQDLSAKIKARDQINLDVQGYSK